MGCLVRHDSQGLWFRGVGVQGLGFGGGYGLPSWG